jgi:tetratricopeptide (TPR) repeat protein
MPNKLPLRPQQHRIGDAASRAFEASCPDSWVLNPSEADYGWDYIINLSSEDTGEVGNEFFAQVKGLDGTDDEVGDRSFISRKFHISTLNWLLDRPIPVLVAACDTSAIDRPVHWVWLDDAIEDLERRNSNWRHQTSTTLRIPPRNNVRKSAAEIETFVQKWHQNRKLAKVILDVLVPVSKRAMLGPMADSLVDPEAFVKTTVIPLVQGITASDGERTQQDARRTHLDRAAALIDEHQLEAAERNLELVKDIDSAEDSAKARFQNLQGLLKLRRGNYEDAKRHFLKASELVANEPKYRVNVLVTEYIDGKGGTDEWMSRLNLVRTEAPEFVPALTLKLRAVGVEHGLAAAEAIAMELRSDKTEDKRKVAIALADVASHADKHDRAMELLDEADRFSTSPDLEALSLRAFTLFAKAIGGRPSGGKVRFEGLGPSQMSIVLINQSAEAYDRACSFAAKSGYPEVAEETFYNAVTVMVMSQRLDDAERLARAYLSQHPESLNMQAALALALTHSDHGTSEAAERAVAVFEEGGDSMAFKNMLLSLIHAEEFHSVTDRVSTRRSVGFFDKSEHVLALELGALADSALGNHTSARSRLNELRSLECNAEADAAEALIAISSGADRIEVAEMMRRALKRHPNDDHLLSLLVRALIPVTEGNATEVISAVEIVATHRQLHLDEAVSLARAHSMRRAFAEAERVLQAAKTRFPRNDDLIFEHAQTLFELGRDEDAFIELQKFLKIGRRTYVAYRNLGQLAWITGRLDDATRLFEMALAKTTDQRDKAELHCQLYELARRQGRSGKALLHHAVEYGRQSKQTPEDEARFLMMFMMAPASAQESDDPELKAWITDFQKRLDAFSSAHPKFHSLRTIRIPEAASDSERAQALLTEVAALTLPAKIFRQRAELQIRSGLWPLPIRAEWLQTSSIFEYWDQCIRSDEFSHAVQIFSGPLVFQDEVQSVSLELPVCIDITALLTLNQLGLLDEVVGLFPYLILALSTREAIEQDAFGVGSQHKIAKALRDWLIANRAQIRTRRVSTNRSKNRRSIGDAYALHGEVWAPQPKTAAELVGYGVGETMLLAGELGVPLYSDDAFMRLWAKEELKVKGISTLSLLRGLRNNDRISLSNETALLARMAELNFRYLAFGPEHLRSALQSLLERNGHPTSVAMSNDPSLGPLLLQFGDLSFSDESMADVSRDAYIQLFAEESIDDYVIAELMATITYRTQQRLSTTMSQEKVLATLASIWSRILSMVYRQDKRLIRRCWNVIRKCVELTFAHDEETFNKFICSFIPNGVYLQLTRGVPKTEAVAALVSLTQDWADPDKTAWETLFLRRAAKDRIIS